MFKNKVVAITGAGSGIGRALALRFAREGAHLALSDIDPLGLQTTREHLPAGCNVKCYTVNVSDQEAVFSHANDVEQDFGTAHVAVNNAGSVLTGTVAQTSIEEYRWLLEINMYGVLYGTKAFLPMMLAQREGWVVNVSSVFGLIGYPAQSAYCMSKFAVRALTECLWSELDGTGVNAVCVHPAGIKTNIGKTGRFARLAGDNERSLDEKLEGMMVQTADSFAEDVLRGLHRGQRRIVAGKRAKSTHLIARLFPAHYPTLLKWFG